MAKTVSIQKPFKNEFGTFSGVFTPSILTILGVIMFMRASFVVGQAGVLGALAILLIAKSLTFFTSLSIGAISTNMTVRGGGAYYLISRVLGPEFGGAIGIALFAALALSVPFYILGFTEALCLTIPDLSPYFLAITLITAAIFFIVAWVGAGWAIKIQFIIMAILILSIVAFMGGAALLFDSARFAENVKSGYTEIAEGKGMYNFWLIFAIYFPAVTGIGAGLNMSGDLKDPAKSIPSGTLWAVAAGFIVYLSQILLSGGAFERVDMIDSPYEILKDNALLGAGVLVAGGVFAATLSSALGSYLGAPRVLQAVSRDPILNVLRVFAKGTPKGDEPRRALVLTGIITLAVLLWAGNSAGGAALNAVAAVITMFFLYSYGMINFAAFVEAVGGNPSFRPTFRYFHWTVALIGAAGCVVVAFLINAVAALVAVLMVGGLYVYVRAGQLKSNFGDARRGLVYSAARKNLLILNRMKEDSRNWRPTVIALASNTETREALANYAIWLEAGRGIVFLTQTLVGDLDECLPRRAGAIRQLKELCDQKGIQAFPVVNVAASPEEGVSMLLQALRVGPIAPNLAVFGWTGAGTEGAARYADNLKLAEALGMSIVVVNPVSVPLNKGRKRIDVWWRGRKNGNIMMILSWLLTRNWEWAETTVRVLRVVENEAGREPAAEALRELIAPARMNAEVKVIVSSDSFEEILKENSRDAACVFLGLALPQKEKEESWHDLYGSLLNDMPTTLLVSSTGGEDMHA